MPVWSVFGVQSRMILTFSFAAGDPAVAPATDAPGVAGAEDDADEQPASERARAATARAAAGLEYLLVELRVDTL
jgi:hypothetical protein